LLADLLTEGVQRYVHPVNHGVKKWLSVGAGLGAGAVLMLGLIIGCIIWYSSRPKPWDQKSLKANSEVLWSFTEDSNSPRGKFENVSFLYVVQNTTNRDITVSSPVTIMLNPESGDLTELPANLYHVQFPNFIPAGRSVQIELDAPVWWYTAGRGKGFILYDHVNHYQINLPEPDGPTEADQKRMNPK
jgi:hypothetical protein